MVTLSSTLSIHAARAAAKIEFHYTPQGARWLNVSEIEFSALARECLHRRIPNPERLEREVLTLLKERAAKGIKINWQFLLQAAREKLNSHYTRVQPDNSQYQKT